MLNYINSKSIIKFIKEITIAVLVVLFIRSFIVQLSLVPSGSMKPNLLEGDFVLVTKYNYGYSRYSLPLNLPLLPNRLWYSEPVIGDIFVFKNPTNLEEEFVKRVIAKGGDKVQIINSVVYINNKPLTKEFIGSIENMGLKYNVYKENGINSTYNVWELEYPYNHYRPQDFNRVNNFGPITIPQNYFFALGDNRHNSQDSRFLGLISKELLVGRPKIILLSVGYAPVTELWKWFTQFKANRTLKILQ